jgi:hypothetical protein
MPWTNTYSPPVLVDPIILRNVADLLAFGADGWTVAYGIVGPGNIWRVSAPAETPERDIYIDFSGQPALVWPLLVDTGGSIIMRAVHVVPEVQAGNDVGDLPNNPTATYPNSNIKPRPPTGRAIGITVKGVAWLEGVHVDLQGHNADCVVWGAPSAGDIPEYNANSSVYLINSRFEHFDGHGISEIGDALHADVFQPQNGMPKNFYSENLVIVSGNEGFVMGGDGGGGTWDEQHYKNISYEESFVWVEGPVSTGAFIATEVPDEKLFIENCWKSGPGPAVHGLGGFRFTPWNEPNGDIPLHYEITGEASPTNDFAPAVDIGTNYTTPFPVYGVFSITSVNGDNTIYHQQPNVLIQTVGAGAVEGIVKYGGITQSGIDWTDGLVKIAEADATDPLVIGNWYDLEIWRPI